MQRLIQWLREPLPADRSLDVMSAAFWACVAGWGIASTLAGLDTIERVAGTHYLGTWWGPTIASLALLAFGASISTFFVSPNVSYRIRRKSVEMVCAIVLLGLIAMYPISLAILAAAGDDNRIAPIFSSLAYMLIPAWRSRHLYLRIRALRIATGEAT